ncbi:hypothetical protein GM3708_1060 [Geminocystis sp. NIES-3708]|uniref:hypothetical protein n=1 Tax=Geminocystis sp. NIES-3708 TaxID=1615909 RepID=UPI0005FC7F66|nr:hypothetical protein [Geminocystis sp. NIES-3708]BAQ60654.1 hypothetical protein GM3708_1060 [Geminocystis sp. NIES-3708]
MLKQINVQFSFIRNCLIIYILVGFLSALIADSHKSFQMSSQSGNSNQLSRIISLAVAYQAKESLYK